MRPAALARARPSVGDGVLGEWLSPAADALSCTPEEEA